MSTCSNCQAPLLEHARFCTTCGAEVNAPAPVAGTPAALSPATVVAAPAPALSSRVSSRTIAIAGLLLCLLFFSPFVSCGARTWTGAQAFQDSLPSRYEGAKDGVLLILLPIAGLAGIVVGLVAMNRAERGGSPGTLRALGAATLLITFMAACPLGIVMIDVNRSNGAFTLEWGFWGSMLAMLAMGWGAVRLLGAKKDAG
jgi:hypothetical protein